MNKIGKNNPVEIATGACPLQIRNLCKSVITFEREQFIIILMIPKQFTMNHHKF